MTVIQSVEVAQPTAKLILGLFVLLRPGVEVIDEPPEDEPYFRTY